MSLMLCPGFDNSPIIVYGDGPRQEDEVADVEATRNVAKELLGTRAEYHFSDGNQGLSRSVIQGLTKAFERFDRVIVVEDDLDVAPGFLAYMNNSLEQYAGATDIYQVSGYQFNVPEFALYQKALFLPIAVSWGWATWRRAWKSFDTNAHGWERLRSDHVLRHEFNLGGTYDYATMLFRQMVGLRDSWAIRWYWTIFCNKGLVLFPPITLVQNTGFDGTGSHGRGLLRNFGATKLNQVVSNIELPLEVQIDSENYIAVKNALWKMNGRWAGFVVDRIRWYSTLFRFSKWG